MEAGGHPRALRRGDLPPAVGPSVSPIRGRFARAGRAAALVLHTVWLLPGALPVQPPPGREAAWAGRGPLVDVRSFTVGPVSENCYLAFHDGADRGVIVDPGDEPERILAAVEAHGIDVDAILLTHCHFDHIGAVAPVAKATRAP